MANYKKTFNFRNGVQVDDKNFIVSPSGLVGIGTTVPTEALDVRNGTVKVSGLVTATSLYVTGFSTFTEVRVGNNIKISSSSGIITATAFYGNGATLSNLPTSQWIDIDVGLGFTSIYNAGYVGIATNDPRYVLQVGGNPNINSGVGINSTGNIKATGFVTAYSFVGYGTGITNINASNISDGTLDNARLPSNISVSGIITASNGFAGNVNGTASLASGLTGTPSITVANVTSSNINNNSGIITSKTINTTLINSGISTSGISTVYTRLYAESIGVGTISPSSDIHVRRTSTSTLQLTSDSAEAIVTLGRTTTLTGSNSALRFGNTSGLQRYSSTKSLDIINYDTGNVNSYLQLGSTGINTGSFNWFYGQTVPNVPLMTLTYGGNLGIGVSNPVEKLKVVGVASITNNLYVDGSINGGSTLTASGNITSVNGNLFAGNNLTVTNITTLNGAATINGDLTVNGAFTPPPPNYTAGIATFYDVIISNNLAIGVNANRGTSALDVLDGDVIFGSVGVGTISPTSAVDFSIAGKNVDATSSFMLPPKLTTTERNTLSIIEGGVIYNTTSKRLEVYLNKGGGNGWAGIATIA